MVDAVPAARKRAADRDDKPPGEAARGRAGATKKAPDPATEKKDAAKSGTAEHAEKARKPREPSRTGRARNAEQKPEKAEKSTADGKGSGRSSRDGGPSKEKADSAAAPVRKDVEQVGNQLVQRSFDAASYSMCCTTSGRMLILYRRWYHFIFTVLRTCKIGDLHDAWCSMCPVSERVCACCAQEKPKKAAAEEERGPLPGRLQREHSVSPPYLQHLLILVACHIFILGLYAVGLLGSFHLRTAQLPPGRRASYFTVVGLLDTPLAMAPVVLMQRPAFFLI